MTSPAASASTIAMNTATARTASGRRRGAGSANDDPAVTPPPPATLGNLDIRVMLVTPAQAAAWLESNTPDNRHQRATKIASYARDMAAGKWQLTGDTVKLTPDGVLIDGQHRMEAVVKANTSVMMVVAFNVAPEAMAVIDTGIARNFADSLRHHSVPNRMVIAAIVRRVAVWDRGNRTGKGGEAPTHAELLQRFEADIARYATAAARGSDVNKAKIAAPGPAGTAFYLFARINADRAHVFFDALITGANLPHNDPILMVRNRLMKAGSRRDDRLTAAETLALLVRGWNAFREERTLGKTQIGAGTLTNANFPTPV